ncbi:MAG TPA: hypothetical protein VMR79_00195, partial [Verrucomicrobiae bacterium]|nr:hypothetical protein [Verrucomicrobiae bacterium]
ISAPCDNSGHIRLKGRLNATTATLSGGMVWAPPPSQHKPPKHGVFTLAKQGAGASHARILHGPSQGAAALTAGQPSPSVVPADGHWALSPEQSRVTLTNLAFQGADGNVTTADLTACVPTYVRDSAALSPILDCPFDVPPGTYVGVGVGVLTTFDVLVDDAANGFFTDPGSPTGLSTSAPAGGAQFASFVVPGPGGQGNVLTSQTFFTSPLVVAAGGSVTLDVVEDMIHTVFANVTGGVASFDTSLPLPAVQLVPSVAGAGRVEFYSANGTALDALMPGPTDDESGSVRVFYANPPQPSYVFSPVPGGPSQAWNVSPATSPVDPSGGFRAGGYLGLDANGVLCWALPTDYTYAQYSKLCEMPIVTSVGASTTLSCQLMTSVPPPVSGDTYASGCPPITPDEVRTLTLVAH